MTMRLLMLITNHGVGGAERVFSDHSDYFRTRYHVEQAVFDGSAPHCYDIGLPCHVIRPGWLARKLGPVGRLVGRSLSLRRLCRARSFDVVISHMDGANWVNALSLSRAKKIFVVHGSVIHDKRLARWQQWFRTKVMIPLTYAVADVVVSVSEGIAAELTSLGVSRVEAIENFVDVSRIRRLSRETCELTDAVFSDGREFIVTVGRLCAAKNYESLLRVFFRVHELRPQAKLVIAGDGELKRYLFELSTQLGLRTVDVSSSQAEAATEADVVFLGHQSNPFKFVRHANLFVFPSLWEGFPLALCEAMACGVPVVSADCPTGPAEILGEQAPKSGSAVLEPTWTNCGVLMPPLVGDVSATQWRDTLIQMLGNVQSCSSIAEGASSRALTFDRDSVMSRWTELIKRIHPEPGNS